MYEKAIELKELLNYIEITLKEQTIDLNTNDNLDVFGYYYDKAYLSLQVFFIRSGKIIGRVSHIFEAIDMPEEELIEYINAFYSKNNIKPKEIIIPNIINKELIEKALEVKVKTPSKGKYKKLLNMANKNAKINFLEKWEILKNNEEKIGNALEELGNKLNIEKVSRIELFDNSNLFGTFYVSGMVVFTDGKPDKKEYRKYKISNPSIKDDINAMKEVIYRRYFRVLMDNLEKPDLIIVDGGKNQINITREVIHSLGLNIPVASLKKDDLHSTSELLGKDPIEIINIDKRSFLFQFLATMQEEVHRFSITYHKINRSKGALASTLDLVGGIGDQRRKLLLRKYGSLSNMKKASLEELNTILPKNIALNLYNFLQKK
jgi:excinuclease ABC subunit C